MSDQRLYDREQRELYAQAPLWPETGAAVVTLTVPVCGLALRRVIDRAERDGTPVTIAAAAILAAGAELEPERLPASRWED